MSLFIYEFLVYRLEIFRNCKEVKHMIMIVAVIYIFFVFYVIFDHQLKITFRKSSALSPSEKIHSLLFTQSSPKNLEIASPPFFAKIEKILAPPPPPCRKSGRTLYDMLFLMVCLQISIIILNKCKQINVFSHQKLSENQ